MQDTLFAMTKNKNINQQHSQLEHLFLQNQEPMEDYFADLKLKITTY